jgi:catechol 2,3-dioxygenase-like lactoylglutathione lyase family enzyme
MTESQASTGGGVASQHVKGLHHIGIPVRDLDRSLDWYRELFGFEAEFIQGAEGNGLDEIVQLSDAKLRMAFIRLPNVLLELLEYERPVGLDFDRRNCDIGAIHVCFEVDDIREVHRRLHEHGISFTTPPIAQEGAIAGHQICYFRDPDGIQLELWQQPLRGVPGDKVGEDAVTQ